MSKFAVDFVRKHRSTLSAILGAVRRVERFLGPDDDWVENDRRILYEAFDGFLGHSTTDEKGTADYAFTAEQSDDLIERILHRNGYERNLASTRKYRTDHDGGKQWAVGSWVLDPADTDWQHHVYLFEAPNGGTDIYAHLEASVRNPVEHLTEVPERGVAPRVAEVLDAEGIEYGERQL